jgi:beta-lactamase superfamily II metal-dependent hydrolase
MEKLLELLKVINYKKKYTYMPYEIDYIPVGDGERSGDAICLRFGNLSGSRSEQVIMVVDGGDKTSGEALVNHIREYYPTNQDGYNDIDYVVSTHPDSDHASGLCTVLEELKVGKLLMHQPWDHMADIKNSFIDGRWTARGLGEKVQKSLTHASELKKIATQKGIEIIEPFQGIKTTDSTIHILGPSKEFYEEMLLGFRSTPKAETIPGFLGTLIKKVEEVIEFIEDGWDLDLLNNDDDTTSAENNTSTIILLTLDDRRILFTADAGKTALLRAIEYADGLNISLTSMELLHVPHHGSKRNLSTKILKKINARIAHISATGESIKHPSKKVINALQKNGVSIVNVSRKQSVLYHNLANSRGWTGVLEKEPFYNKVEN